MIRLLVLLLVGFGLPLGAMGSQEVAEISAYEVMGFLAVLALFFWNLQKILTRAIKLK